MTKTPSGKPSIETNENSTMTPVALEVLRQFRLIFGSVRQHFREVEESCGISGSQLWLLTETKRVPGIGISELAKRLGIHQSTSSILVEKLVSNGLLAKQRSSDDQRRVGLYATSKGETVLLKRPGPSEGILPDALNSLPDGVLKTLNINLDALVRALHTHEDRFAAMPLADIVAGHAEQRPATSHS